MAKGMERGSGILSISFDARNVINMLEGFTRTLPKAMDKGAKNVAGTYALKYLEQMDRAKGIGGGLKNITPWTGQAFKLLRKQIKNPIHLEKGSYGVVVPINLIHLDRMPIHDVFVTGRLRQWARKKAPWALNRISIEVHPHPWIDNANRNARRLVKNIPRKELRKALARKGR